MHNPDKWVDLLQVNEYFNLPQSKNISSGILLLYDKKIEQFDIDTLYNNIIESGKEIEKHHISDIYNNILNFDNIENAIDLLKKDHIRFKINDELLSDLFNLTNSNNLRETTGLDKFEESLDNIKDALVKIKNTDELLWDSNRLQDFFLNSLEEKNKITIKTSYGDRDLDALLNYPARPKEMTTLFGQKGSGKSSFSLHLINGLIPSGIPILYISLEDSKDIVMEKIASMRSDITFNTISMGNFKTRDEYNNVKLVSHSMRQYNNFFLVDDPNLYIKDVEMLIKKVQTITGKKYVFIVIDVLTMLLDFAEKGDDAKVIKNCVYKLQRLVKSTETHILNICQENENIWRNNSKAIKVKDLQYYRPTIQSIKGGAEIASGSRLVLYIWNFEYMRQAFISDYDQLEEDLKDLEIESGGLPIIEIKVLKYNRGKVGGKLKYIYDGNYFRFTIFKE